MNLCTCARTYVYVHVCVCVCLCVCMCPCIPVFPRGSYLQGKKLSGGLKSVKARAPVYGGELLLCCACTGVRKPKVKLCSFFAL